MQSSTFKDIPSKDKGVEECISSFPPKQEKPHRKYWAVTLKTDCLDTKHFHCHSLSVWDYMELTPKLSQIPDTAEQQAQGRRKASQLANEILPKHPCVTSVAVLLTGWEIQLDLKQCKQQFCRLHWPKVFWNTNETALRQSQGFKII